MIREENIQKIALITAFLSLTAALIVTWNTPAIGYEASIYNSTPQILWVSLIFSVIIGVLLVIYTISKQNLRENRIWIIGLLLVFLCYTISLGLSTIRGYYMWRVNGDPATHIGWVIEILQSGHLSPEVIYPVTHIYLSSITLITDYNLIHLVKIVPLVFALLCIVYIYLFIRVIAVNPAEPIVGVLVSCTLAYGWYLDFVPNGLLTLFFPFALLITFHNIKQNTKNWLILLFIIVILFAVFHPVPTLFLALVLLTVRWAPIILNRPKSIFNGQIANILNFNHFDLRLTIPLLVLVIWFTLWISSFTLWNWTIWNIYQSVISEGGASQVGTLMDQVSMAQMYGYNILEQIFKRLGGPIVLFSLSVLSLPILWISYSRGQEKARYLLSLYGPFGILSIVLPALYILNLGFDPFRFVAYISILGTAFTAYFISSLLTINRGEKYKNTSIITGCLIALLLIGLFLGGLLNLYPSPYNMILNHQTPHAEVAGMEHLYDHQDLSNRMSVISVAPGRYADLFLTPEQRANQRIPRYAVNPEDKAPWHFGYDKYPSISSSYNEKSYLIISQRDKIIYKDALPEMAQYRFKSEDFERLESDPGINHLYINGGFDVWRIVTRKCRVE